MGIGRGVGLPQAPAAMPGPPVQDLSKAEELALLKQQAEAISQQMQQIQARINQMEQEQE